MFEQRTYASMHSAYLFSNNKNCPCLVMICSLLNNKAVTNMTNNQKPISMTNRYSRTTNYTPATWCRKKERDTFRPLPVFEHVHHPGGEGVDLVGVVPKDETSHPLLILTVARKNRKLHTSNCARRRQCENIASKYLSK
jgi:hypothetical protein